MNLFVITPIGPGHEEVAVRARRSVANAKNHSLGSFEGVKIVEVHDADGRLGRSAARNKAMRQAQAADGDWFFFLDADDWMDVSALENFPVKSGDQNTKAVFGSIWTDKKGQPQRYEIDAKIRSFEDLVKGRAVGRIAMGSFFSATEAREHGFREDLDAGEDYEFYLSFLAKHNFMKVWGVCFCVISMRTPSAVGPRGYRSLNWEATCMPFVKYWRGRGRIPINQEVRLKKNYWIDGEEA